MKKLLEKMLHDIENGPVMLVSVTAASGSTPRGAGAMMVVAPDGSFQGTIGGGAVEYAAQKRAGELLKEGRSESKGYVLSKADVAGLGMICGGDVTVYFQYITKDNAAPFRYLSEAMDRDESVWLVRTKDGELFTSTGVWGDSGLMFTDAVSGDQVRPMLRSRAMLSDEMYVEPISLAGKTYVFGGGHVAQELVPVLSHVGFRCVVFEDRPDFAKRELFPEAFGIVLGDFDRISEKIKIGPADNAIIMTRGHGFDFEVIAQVLATPASYIGCIGSGKKVAATRARLFNERGIGEDEFARVHTPIGLKILAETPAEIAISIAGEMIKYRAEEH